MIAAGPLYTHDCDQCVFCGHMPFRERNIADVYICRRTKTRARVHTTVVVRYSDEGSEYTSLPIEIAERRPDYAEAIRLANKKLDDLGL